MIKSARPAIAAIDVGTTKVCTLVGETSERGDGSSAGDLRIVGVGVSPSRGLRKGIVVNATEASEAIVASVERAERISGYDIARAHVGIAGAHIASVNSRGVVGIPHGERGITEDDVARALEASRAVSVPEHHHILHVIPRGYLIDGQEGVSDPRGMYGARLEVEAHIVTGSALSIQNLVKCVHALNVDVDELVLAPLAAGEAVLTHTERAMGVALADIGGGTTDIAIFIEGSVWHTAILPVGGHHLTNDVAICLRTPFDQAEEIKKAHGHACLNQPDAGEELDIAAFGEQAHQKITKGQLAQVLNARVQEIASLILQEIKRSGYDGLLPAGVVLCGGTSELKGICNIMREVIGLPVRVGRPHDLQGLVDVLAHPAYATSVGLLLWAQNQELMVSSHAPPEWGYVPPDWGRSYDIRSQARMWSGSTLTGRVARWLRNLLPD